MATMLNAIGDRPGDSELENAGVDLIDELGDGGSPLGSGQARWHDYRKTPRPGRKVGHLTIVGDSIDEQRVAELAAMVPGAAEAPSLASGE
jgi:phosphoribosylaminoimidazole carboxylase (NCAIR synthetase)